MGAAWPLDRTNSSLPQSSGSLTSYLISLKKRQAMRSAIDKQVVGWPEPARVVMRREWMRSRGAIFWRTSAFVIDFVLSLKQRLKDAHYNINRKEGATKIAVSPQRVRTGPKNHLGIPLRRLLTASTTRLKMEPEDEAPCKKEGTYRWKTCIRR